MKLLTKTGKQIIDRTTKLPIYTKTVEHRINSVYKELIGMTKSQFNSMTNSQREAYLAENQGIKEKLYAVKMAGIQSSLNSLPSNFFQFK